MTDSDLAGQNKNWYGGFWAHFIITVIILVIVAIGGFFIKQQYDQKNHLTQDNFNSVELSQTDGDSLDDVTDLFGRKPSSVSKTQEKGIVTQLAAWKTVAHASENSHVYIYFDDGHAVSKAIKGLKRDRVKKVSHREFGTLTLGMHKADVARRIGTPNDYTFDERYYGINSEQWTYTSNDLKGKRSVVITLLFKNGALADKTQTRLK